MPDDPSNKATASVVGLLAASLALSFVDFVLFGLAGAFGPSGFGGDRTMTRREVLIANLGQAAGLSGCLLGSAAIVWAIAAASGPARSRGLKWILGGQLIATAAAVVASTL